MTEAEIIASLQPDMRAKYLADQARAAAVRSCKLSEMRLERAVTSVAALANTSNITRATVEPNDGLDPLFRAALKDAALPVPVCEHPFCEGRKWRLDHAWPAWKVGLEIEGGVWTQGRHTRGKGYCGDLAKYSEAAAMGWLIIRCVPDDQIKAVTLDRVKRALMTKGWTP